jgi:hypothetical protein
MAVIEIPPVGEAPRLTDLLAAGTPLTFDERRLIVQQAQLMIEELYVHLPLKRAMHAVDPVQRLRLVERRLESYSDRRFHDEMISIFIGLRDLHTNYVLPAPFAGKIAFLPFRIEAFWEGDARRYLVTGVTPDLNAPPFGLGVGVTHWNGIPMDRAVSLNGERNGGSNVEARHARGLSSMTQRPMGLLSAPDEEWVDISFVAEGAVHQARFPWQVLDPPAAPTAAVPSSHADPIGGALGLDALTEEVRRAQKTVLAPDAIELEQTTAAEGVPADQLDTASTLPDVLQFRRVPGPHGDLGYLRIRTFVVGNSIEAFLNEVVRILELLPQNGLIIDVRGNGGGIIAAGELMLQLLTPQTIEPEHLHFINTPLTFELTAHPDSRFEPWHQSIGEAVETGTPFSDGLPLADGYREACNSIGQRYFGPVVLVTDALCYSTTDIFSAGFQDHQIGPVIGSGNTGAGGANVWTYADVLQALPTHFKPLPKQASMRVAIRRTTRVGARAGDPLEDLGVVSDIVYKMTRRDLLQQNVDLIAKAGAVLDAMPRRALAVQLTATAGGVAVAMTTAGLDRLDIYVDERPVATLDVADGEHTRSVALVADGSHVIEVRGFSAGELAASRKENVG